MKLASDIDLRALAQEGEELFEVLAGEEDAGFRRRRWRGGHGGGCGLGFGGRGSGLGHGDGFTNGRDAEGEAVFAGRNPLLSLVVTLIGALHDLPLKLSGLHAHFVGTGHLRRGRKLDLFRREEFEGVVPANEVLSRSLSVPSVRMLHQYGVQKFIYQLNKAGLNSISKPGSYYGLSLILGGGEATLWEMSGAYMNLLRASKNEYQSIAPYYTKQDSSVFNHAFSAIVSAQTLKAISESKRMGADGDWVDFSNSQTIAWKTGTSFGARDAWSIGVSGRYVVGVWIGNADGEGRNGLTGIGMASPIMFDMFSLLPKTV